MNIRNRMLVISLWLSVIGFSTWIGGTLYQMLVVVPMWSVSPPDSVRWFFHTTQYNHLIFRFFGPPFMLARTLPVLAALIIGWHLPRQRRALLLASACLVFAVVFTLLYVYPMNAVLFERAGGHLGTEEVQALAERWIFADRFRFAVGVVGFLALMHAFRLPLPDEETR